MSKEEGKQGRGAMEQAGLFSLLGGVVALGSKLLLLLLAAVGIHQEWFPPEQQLWLVVLCGSLGSFFGGSWALRRAVPGTTFPVGLGSGLAEMGLLLLASLGLGGGVLAGCSPWLLLSILLGSGGATLLAGKGRKKRGGARPGKGGRRRSGRRKNDR